MSKKLIQTFENKKTIEEIFFEEGQSNILFAGTTSSALQIIEPNENRQITFLPNTSVLYQYVKAKTNLSFTSTNNVYIAGGSRTIYDNNDSFIAGYGGSGASHNLLFEANFPNYPLASITFYADSNGTQVSIGCSTSYIRMTNDFNFNAEQTCIWIGDSVTAGTFNSNVRRNDLFHFQVKHFLENKLGKLLRNVILAKGGQQTNDFVDIWRRNMILPSNPKIIFLMTGINDQSQSINLDIYESNLREIVQLKNIKYPNTIIIFISATPVEDDSRETSLASYRQRMNDVVFSINSPLLKYIDLTNCYDRTLGSLIWATSDGSGSDRLHPGTELAMTGISNRINDFLDTLF